MAGTTRACLPSAVCAADVADDRRAGQKGLAYRAADGDVNYAVRKFAGYGKLSGKSLEDLRAGERVDVNSGKHDPLDFVLWKHAKQGEPDEVQWDSPWGKGRPGWHIECSAMGSELLGKHFNIHGGGADRQFPHHENEIAQSEGAHRCQASQGFRHSGSYTQGIAGGGGGWCWKI